MYVTITWFHGWSRRKRNGWFWSSLSTIVLDWLLQTLADSPLKTLSTFPKNPFFLQRYDGTYTNRDLASSWLQLTTQRRTSCYPNKMGTQNNDHTYTTKWPSSGIRVKIPRRQQWVTPIATYTITKRQHTCKQSCNHLPLTLSNDRRSVDASWHRRKKNSSWSCVRQQHQLCFLCGWGWELLWVQERRPSSNEMI